VTPSAPEGSNCAGLVLAAGEGSRFGGPKALVELDGELLVDRAVRTLAAGGCEPVVVVLGAAADAVCLQARLDHAVVVVNDGWAEGIGSSLRVGLRVLAEAGAGRVVVALADQPRVTPAVVRRLVEAPPEVVAVVASYAGRPGNPARLDASVWPDVAAGAVGDVGARAWMRAHPEHVQVVACDDLGSDDDIDTPGDLTRLVEDMEPKA
jgi:CTP:molybdopterin cytidylyltransferase MocA